MRAEVVAPDRSAAVAASAGLVAFLPAQLRGVELDRVGGAGGHGFSRANGCHGAPQATCVRGRCAPPRRAESGSVPALTAIVPWAAWRDWAVIAKKGNIEWPLFCPPFCLPVLACNPSATRYPRRYNQAEEPWKAEDSSTLEQL